MKVRSATFIVVILLSAAILSSIQFLAEGEKTSHFYTNDGTTVSGGNIGLTDGGGMETSYYFRVGKNVPISYAYMNISTRNTDVGMAIDEPYLDIGVDGNREWEYKGTGYGKFGELDSFDDDKLKKSMNFPTSGGYNSANSILIPADSEINEAEIDIRGRFIPQSISSYTVQSDPSSISMTGYNMQEGDIDQDGDIDVVVSDTRNHRILWFENPGNNSMKWPAHTVYSGSSYIYNVYSIDLGDMDGDGDLDVVASSYSRGYIMYIRNNNQGSTWSMYRFYTGFRYAGTVKIADMDQDGNPDIVAASWYNYYYYNDEFLYWFKAPSNPNTTSGWSAYRIDSSPTYYIYTYFGMDIGDMNGDGYPDVAMALYPQYTWYGNYNRIYAYINPKNPGSTFTRTTVDSSANRAHSLAVGDISGDGKCDIVAATYDGGRVTYYNNTNNGASWSESTIGTMSYPRYVRIVDFDGDGKNDTVAGGGSGSYELATFTQGSTTSQWTKNSVTREVMNPQAFAVFDMDGDDDLDFLAAGTSASQLVHIETLNIATPTFKLTWLEDGGVKDVRAIDFHDMDGDGDEDIILVGYATGWVGWCENDGTPFSGTGTLYKIGSIGNPIKVMAADVDGDDDHDIVALSSGGVALWYENRGDPYVAWEPYQIGSGITSAYSMFAGDFTNDGKADLVTSSARGYSGGFIRIYKAPLDPRVPNWGYNTIANNIQYLKNIWADDMDLDGDLDVLAAYGAYGSGAVVYYKNPTAQGGNPMSGTWSSVNIGGGMYYTEDVKTIDVTDDGWPDVVTTGSYYYSKVHWFESKNGASFTKRVLYGSAYNWNLAVGDIGNDGYADIVFNRGSYSSPSSIYWYEEPEDYSQGWLAHSLGSYSGTWALGIADLDGDDLGEIYSSSTSSDQTRAYRINAVYPQNVALDVGGDETSSDWVLSGQLKGEASIDFKRALQDVIDTEPGSVTKTVDQWGTPLLRIPLEIYSSTLGKVGLEDIHITYNVTVKITQDGNGNNLATVLDRLIPDHVDEDPYLRIYVGVGGSSEGHASISALTVEYNAIPRLVKPLPEFRLKEDSKETFNIDLAEYFSDDYTPSEDMKYRISVTGTNADKIDAYIIGRKVVIDSTITENFYSRGYSPYDVKGVLIVEDAGGPNNVPSRTYKTNEFPIIVEPVNDPPERTGENLPLLTAYEGQESTLVDLDDHNLFFDVDGDKLNFMVLPMFDDNYDEDAGFEIKWVSKENTIHVKLNENSDWTGDVKARIYATDESEFNFNGNPYVDFIVKVINVNDGPHWTSIEDLQAVEDIPSMRLVEVSQFVEDIDTPRSDLEFYVESYTNMSFLTISYERTQTNQIYINFEPRSENWNGMTTVTLSVSDGEFRDETTFDIVVHPVNDIPSIRIVEPVENGRVEPGFFSVVGEAHDVEGIEYVEVYFDGKWNTAMGLNSWGVTLEAKGTESIQESVPIQARVFDGETYTYAYTNMTIMPLQVVADMDYDNDGVPNQVDLFDYDPSEWSDRDNDGVGDNTDKWPDEAQWWADADGDNFADQADTHPTDPELWDDKDNDGRNDFLPPLNRGDDNQEETSYLWPIVLFIVAGLLLVLAIAFLVLFIRKRDAATDPRKMAKYYAKQQRMREARHNFIEKLPLAKLADNFSQIGGGTTPSNLPTPSRPGMASPTMVRPSTVLPSRPAPALPPRAAPSAPMPIARPMQPPIPPSQRPPQ